MGFFDDVGDFFEDTISDAGDFIEGAGRSIGEQFGIVFGGPENTGIAQLLPQFRAGQQALVGQGIRNLREQAPANLNQLRGAVPELRAAADVARGDSLRGDFSAALSAAGGARGVNVSPGGDEQLAFFENQFLPQTTELALRTGFEDLRFAGVGPPPRVSFGQFAQTRLDKERFEQEKAAGSLQSLFSAALLPFSFF